MVDNCARLDPSSETCTVCGEEILVNNGACGATKCSITNCRYCAYEDDVEYCVACKTGYSLFISD